jgi:putative ABC transport system substrate-binding protein
MIRRDFITLLGRVLTFWPLAATAQQLARVPVIGFLGAGTQSGAARWVDAFLGRLHELGWIEDGNLRIEYRWAEGRTERYAEIAAEFVGRRVDLIVTYGTAPVVAAKDATTTIPIVFATAGDPMGAGLVASLSRPGGNITGLSMLETDSGPKRVELLHEIVPSVSRLGIIGNADSAGAMLEMKEAEAAARKLGLRTYTFKIQKAEDIKAAFEGFKNQVDAVAVTTDPLMFSNRAMVDSLALDARLPTICDYRIR